MKKQMLFSILVVGLVTNSILVGTEEVLKKLSSQSYLEKDLNQHGFEFFNRKMNLSHKFADQKMYPSGVATALELAICEFCKEYSNPQDPQATTPCHIANKSKDAILKVLLESSRILLPHEK